MLPIVNGLEGEFGDQMAFERRDANQPDGDVVMDVYGLRGHPSYVIVTPEGEVVWSGTGAVPENTLHRQIVETLGATD